VSVSFAGLTFCAVKERYGRERASARVMVEEAVGVVADWAGPFLLRCRCNCRAFARFFSCVRTK
jgi:hypothetical protein